MYANRVVSFADIEAARERSKGAVYYSPCLPSIPLSELTGMEIFCKLDNLQRTGSFKERGARNVLSQLPAEQKNAESSQPPLEITARPSPTRANCWVCPRRS